MVSMVYLVGIIPHQLARCGMLTTHPAVQRQAENERIRARWADGQPTHSIDRRDGVRMRYFRRAGTRILPRDPADEHSSHRVSPTVASQPALHSPCTLDVVQRAHPKQRYDNHSCT